VGAEGVEGVFRRRPAVAGWGAEAGGEAEAGGGSMSLPRGVKTVVVSRLTSAAVPLPPHLLYGGGRGTTRRGAGACWLSAVGGAVGRYLGTEPMTGLRGACFLVYFLPAHAGLGLLPAAMSAFTILLAARRFLLSCSFHRASSKGDFFALRAASPARFSLLRITTSEAPSAPSNSRWVAVVGRGVISVGSEETVMGGSVLPLGGASSLADNTGAAGPPVTATSWRTSTGVRRSARGPREEELNLRRGRAVDLWDWGVVGC
jgi:hypothetical protein